LADIGYRVILLSKSAAGVFQVAQIWHLDC